MRDKVLAPLIERLLVRNGSVAALPALDATPILLIDLVAPGRHNLPRHNLPCRVSTLGSVLRGSKWRTLA